MFPVPAKLPDLLFDFSKQVIRDQPKDIFSYGAEYFKALDEDQDQSNKEND